MSLTEIFKSSLAMSRPHIRHVYCLEYKSRKMQYVLFIHLPLLNSFVNIEVRNMQCCTNPVKAIFKSCVVVVYRCHTEQALWEDRLLTDSRGVRLLLCVKVLEVWSNRKLLSSRICMGLTLKYRSDGLSVSKPDQTQSGSLSLYSLHLRCNNLSYCFSTFQPLILF